MDNRTRTEKQDWEKQWQRDCDLRDLFGKVMLSALIDSPVVLEEFLDSLGDDDRWNVEQVARKIHRITVDRIGY